MLVKLRTVPKFYLLHADGVGEYAMRRGDGARCLFVFTGRKTICDFIERMEQPEHKAFTAVDFDSAQLLGLLREVLPQNRFVAVNPVANCQFSPIEMQDFVRALGASDGWVEDGNDVGSPP
jgi:hypothetical protein